MHEIAEYARSTAIYEKSKEQADTFKEEFFAGKDTSPEHLFIHILDRVVNAPTTIHRDASAILLMPLLDEMLTGAERTLTENEQQI